MFNFDNIDQIIKESILIGKGSSRKVYLLKNGYVCKVAINNKGLDQNYTEYSLHEETEYFNNINDISGNYKYLIVESCQKVKSIKQVRELLGITQEEFKDILMDLEVNYNLCQGDTRRYSSWGINKEGIPVLVDYGLTKEVYNKHYCIFTKRLNYIKKYA